MSHPAHPATVHFPITTTFLTGALDAVYFASTYAPTATAVASAFKTFDIQIQPSLFPTLSYYTTILTLLFSAPAVATGVQQLMPTIQRDGFSSKKAKVGALHAVLNDITVVGALYNWWSRRSNPGLVPSNENILISTVLAVPTVLFAAYLGGSLVYIHGMGFQNRSVKKKQ
ncbi:hypothetical protein FB567DRAFT_172403 [Paraphoma chrysanthemicola]|uniref:DUF2231 domain-containing protein n=1 Tax=Paraphoma chrysanthemicola TaxID=798071 RepID=A0A8K0W3D1_9PLEO|nr:hypothetical protein FB567DRAFT_172403 [Paraphoma chrysanthemicola]